MNNDYRSGRPLQGLLTMALVGAVAIGVALTAYFAVIKPAFATVTAAFEQVEKATDGAR